MEVLTLNLVSGSRYLGEYLGPHLELEAWVNPKWRYGTTGYEF